MKKKVSPDPKPDPTPPPEAVAEFVPKYPDRQTLADFAMAMHKLREAASEAIKQARIAKAGGWPLVDPTTDEDGQPASRVQQVDNLLTDEAQGLRWVIDDVQGILDDLVSENAEPWAIAILTGKKWPPPAPRRNRSTKEPKP